VTDFLDEKRQEIRGRLAELKPLVDEYSRLEAAAAALEGVGGAAPAAATATATPARRGPGRPKGSGRKPGRPKGSGRKPGRPKGSKNSTTAAAAPAATATKETAAPARRGRPPGRPPGRPAGSTGRKAGRRKGSGTRSAEALAIVREQPGVTIPELAARMGIKQNYLYRVLPSLEQENKVAKQGRGWHPKAA
jgi:hypothetical protein